MPVRFGKRQSHPKEVGIGQEVEEGRRGGAKSEREKGERERKGGRES